MISGWWGRVLGAPGAASFRRFEPSVREAGTRADWARSLSDRALADETGRGIRPGTRPTGITASADALAALREAATRALGQRPFDEQLLACCALIGGHAVELDTGEGKTLVGALAAAGFALAGRRVHVLSVNDYLAQRDAEWMGPLFALLGLDVGWIGQHTSPPDRRESYRRPIVYAPVSEIGYDILRDRFATADAERMDPVLDVVIVDEADAVMIDEAMSPLVLAGDSPDEADDLATATELAELLRPGLHFEIDDDQATVSLTDAGLDLLEHRLDGVNLYDADHAATLTRINLALHARELVRRDVDYLVVDGAIKLINTARGRIAHQQRWPDGLHAAIEAKERLAVSSGGLILDSLTVHDLLRQYRTLSGMSGTMVAVAEELTEFYEVRTGRVERRLSSRRVDHAPHVFASGRERTDAVVAEVRSRHAAGQPVLVGTLSVAESEEVAAALAGAGIDARVLNARNDAHEAAVIARAGELGAVTISTQLSGRGTDIRLGGPDERDRQRVVGAGGLAVIATGRYPSGRLDAQLRGRAGRQGDPGAGLVFVSITDELVQANAPAHVLEQLRRHAARMDAASLSRIVDRAQRIAEGVRRDRHRDTWDSTRAISRQRATVLAHRDEVLREGRAEAELEARIPAALAVLRERTDAARVAAVTRDVTLWCLDEEWGEHLARLSEVRDGIHLQALAGVNPRDEFHRIALRAFAGYFAAVYDRAEGIIAGVAPDQVGDIADIGLRRPSATWTYMISDNPLGSPMDRAARAAGRWWRGRVLGIE